MIQLDLYSVDYIIDSKTDKRFLRINVKYGDEKITTFIPDERIKHEKKNPKMREILETDPTEHE